MKYFFLISKYSPNSATPQVKSHSFGNHWWLPAKHNNHKQAGAELCQAQHSLSSDLDTN